MKQIVALLIVLLFGSNAFSQSSRTNILLKTISWKVYSGNEKTELNSIYSNAVEGEGDIMPDQLVVGKISFDQLSSMATFFHYGSKQIFQFQLNDHLLKNELAGYDFYADITPLLSLGENYILLKTNKTVSKKDFVEALSNTQISLLDGIVFTKFEVKKDTYFGGNLIEAKVHNFNAKDIDGKIIGKLIVPETLELIAENSNCAYTRSGQDLTVDIIFPDLKLDLTGKKIVVELTMVDKENNEEVVDVLTLPVFF